MNNFEFSEKMKKRTKEFAVHVVRFYRSLPKTDEARVLGRQILRSGTSVAANYRAVCRAKSTADFINKLRIVEEECDESLFWMKLLVDNNFVKPSRLTALMKEADELLAIIVSAAKPLAPQGARKS